MATYNTAPSGYVRLYDVSKQIQQVPLNQLTGNDPGLMTLCLDLATEEASSYLSGKYDTENEFSETFSYAFDEVLVPADRQTWDLPAFDPTQTYQVGAGVTVGSDEYLAVVAVSPGAFNPAQWLLVPGVSLNTIQYVDYPYPLFQYQSFYRAGDRVTWQGSVYQCVQGTIPVGHQEMLNRGVYPLYPVPNQFPGMVPGVNGSQWSPGTPYSFSFSGLYGSVPGSPIPAWDSLTTYPVGLGVTYGGQTWYAVTGVAGNVPGADVYSWLPVSITIGDNRSQQVVQVVIDIALYHLHSRLAPRNIPELRTRRYERALRWLDDAAHGVVTPQMIQLNQPELGARISFGSSVKRVNAF
jgi:hypothetical protein